MLAREANRRPRRRWMAQRDLGYYHRPADVTGPGLVYRSGPFKRRRFWSEERARAWAGEHGDVFELQWVRVEES